MNSLDIRFCKCVTIGGGTGLSTLLKGLKSYVWQEGEIIKQHFALERLTAVVTVTDDGGSSGRLRKKFNIPPPGDIRNCLVALSEDEKLLSQLFQHRFSGKGGISGHSFGNLFLAALTSVTGDFVKAVKLCSEVLAIKGTIVPSTTSDVKLIAELKDGSVVKGETKISNSRNPIKRIFLEPENCEPLQETLEAICQADIITFGPGSLFTSIIPNLLVKGITKAIVESKATKIYICNVMTQFGETTDFNFKDHVKSLLLYLPVKALDAIIVNNEIISRDLLLQYKKEGAKPIFFDNSSGKPLKNNSSSERIEYLQISNKLIPIILSNLLEETKVVRHSPSKLAKTVLNTYSKLLPENNLSRVAEKDRYSN